VYIPLGGNRRHKLRNIAIVWLLTGLWHGASWSFVLWGAYYCALLILEKYVFARIRLNVPSVVRGLYAFFAAVIGWVIFYFTDVRKAGAALAAMFTHRAADLQTSVAFRQNAVFLLVCVIAATPIVPRLYRRVTDAISRKREGAATALDTALSAAYIGVLLAVCCAVLVGSSFSPFLYFKF
jgi:alginate O-acetyltransferase complex protein AlgI